MAAPNVLRPKLAALDTNILFHLAEDYAPAHNLVRRLVKFGFTPIVTQTVVTTYRAERHQRIHEGDEKGGRIFVNLCAFLRLYMLEDSVLFSNKVWPRRGTR